MTLVLLQLIFRSLSLHRSIASRLGKVERHGLAKELETVDFINGVFRALCLVKHDESLSSALQAAFRDNVYNVAIFTKDLAKRFDEGWDLDALLEISGLFVSC